ncbi:hypothetical protein M1N59_01990, partial [Dehalococcoidales bacterium]|nr:hypothetical protein [Dehalococcoidales bacterium]
AFSRRGGSGIPGTWYRTLGTDRLLPRDLKESKARGWCQSSSNNGMAGAYQRYERRRKKASSSCGVLVADSTGVKTGKTKRGSSLNLAIKMTGREIQESKAEENWSA